MKVHFIAIGGSAMHNLAIALSRKGVSVTGSDDEIFEPSYSRLKNQGILPTEIGWNVSNITSELSAVILGMHAREDNPELLKAKELNIPIFSYPEYLYEQSKDKLRIVIGGSHGKTTITSMLLHAIKAIGINVDYMVGAQLDGYDCMVKLSDEAKYMILEGDEYLSSPIDRRPKFHLYQPNVALLSGIAWDHINVFKTFEDYIEQFNVFADLISDTLIYNEEDVEVNKIGKRIASKTNTIPYSIPSYKTSNTGTILEWNGKEYELQIFGQHNLQNLIGAMHLATFVGIQHEDFLNAMKTFKGAGKRLQKVIEKNSFVMFKDFAHSPSKLKATTAAVKEQYTNRKVVACMELHTFSSLNKDFLPLYKDAMNSADVAIVYFNPKVVEHKKLPPLNALEVKNYFGQNVIVETNTDALYNYLIQQEWNNSVLLMMSSGNFDGINFDVLGEDILNRQAN
jgi:UDP-N-acetylmuramate: L-alanyl-gamma-D-glutamyl-meso-diaminopimelate ligase